ncbi:HAMP domain-containing protein [Hymenobacter sp. UV11]|uniref:sensor histidine kinase n=1 Tax=Hymenobacter sp. UV11 TaxID=1849735 RepID=UPI00105C0066|nr:ATP-binding protein [Hymenobacter sp. UV11]TDN36031.1 histidine kinase [Hymenobacter sp. UV11]TFZ68148.1 HAMP domain-containing protein [Hymenobacter sp. UV11]
MRLRLALFLLPLYAVLVALAAQVRLSNPALFIACEVTILVSAGLTWRLYRGLVQPVRLIEAGTAALAAQDFNLKFIPVGQPELDRLIGVYNQMLDALRQERIGQHEQSVLLERLIGASPAGMLLLDFDGNITSANAAAARALGQPATALAGQSVAALPPPWGPMLANLAAGEPRTLRLPTGHTYRAAAAHFLDRGFQRRFVVLEELTQEILAQEKQAYEQLIRLMAHEVNNSIGAVNSLLGSFRHYAPQLAATDQPDFTQALEVSITRNTQLADFVARYARLVRLPPPAPHPLDLHQLLRDLGHLLAAQSAAQGVQWHWELAGPGPLWVEADSQQLTQALLNVAKNALEAIGPGGGHVWVRTTAAPPTLVMENDGAPLTPAVSQRLFTPFFSTKRDGQGIGLLLVRDILRAHGFAFRLETGTSGRTAFTCNLLPNSGN